MNIFFRTLQYVCVCACSPLSLCYMVPKALNLWSPNAQNTIYCHSFFCKEQAEP